MYLFKKFEDSCKLCQSVLHSIFPLLVCFIITWYFTQWISLIDLHFLFCLLDPEWSSDSGETEGQRDDARHGDLR